MRLAMRRPAITAMASLRATLLLVLCLTALRGTIAARSEENLNNAGGRGGEGDEESRDTYGGSSSNSNGGLNDTEQCVSSVLPTDDDEGNSITNSTAYKDIMCNLLCMEKVTNNSIYQDAEIEDRTIGGVWRFRFFPQFNPDNEDTNCPAYQQLAECVRGCMVRVEQNATGLSGNKCKKECKSQCDNEVRYIDDHYFNPYCLIDCNNTICRKGCDTYEMIEFSSSRPGGPPSQVSAPYIQLDEDTTDVSVRLLHAVPASNDVTRPLTPVGILYRIRDHRMHITSYFGQVDPEQPLALDQYACHNISLSFVVVNRFGVSQESQSVSFRVSGESISVKPTDITVGSVRLDKRPGFFGHVFLTISWQHPPGYVEHYTVKAFPFSSENVYTSPRLNTTTLTVNSEKESDSIFVLGKRLDIFVCSVVENAERECEKKMYNIPEYGELEQNPVRITGCIPQWNGTLFNYTLHWKVPEFVAFGSGIFSRFSLLVESILERNERYIDLHYVQKSPNQTSYSYTWKNLKPLEAQFYYEFEVSIEWASLTYHPPSQPVTCVRQAIPPPPSPVVNVTLSDVVIDENIQFIFQWKPPVTTNGQLTHYFCCLGSRPFDLSVPSSDENDTHCITLDSDKTFAFWDHCNPQQECLYFQMRAHTRFGGGNWSEPVMITHGEIIYGGDCSQTPTTVTLTDSIIVSGEGSAENFTTVTTTDGIEKLVSASYIPAFVAISLMYTHVM